MKKNEQISRREAISLFSMGIIATQIPFDGKGNVILSKLDNKNLHFQTLSEVAELIKSRKITYIE